MHCFTLKLVVKIVVRIIHRSTFSIFSATMYGCCEV